MIKTKWWEEKYGFFGNFYIDGDNSLEGYKENPQTLEERTSKEVKGIVFLLKLRNGSKILDIPCGYGRHAIELARMGFGVIGSDLNLIHLNKAKKDAARKKADVAWKQESMLNIKYSEEFDIVINMFYSFGFFEKDSDNVIALGKMYNALRKGGKFLFHTDVNVQRVLSGKYRLEEIRHLKSGNKLKISERFDFKTKRMNGSWTIIKKDGSETSRNYSLRVYTKEEFMQICRKIGFRKVTACGDWDGSPYTKHSEDMIIVAEK